MKIVEAVEDGNELKIKTEETDSKIEKSGKGDKWSPNKNKLVKSYIIDISKSKNVYDAFEEIAKKIRREETLKEWDLEGWNKGDKLPKRLQMKYDRAPFTCVTLAVYEPLSEDEADILYAAAKSAKIKESEKQPVQEAAGKKCWVIYSEEQYEGIASINGVFTSKDQAEKVFKKLEEKEGRSDFTWYCEEMDLDTEWEDPLN